MISHKGQSNRHATGRCSRLVSVGAFAHRDHAGRNRFRFTGRLNGRTLPAGPYLVQATARYAGRASRPMTVRITIRPHSPSSPPVALMASRQQVLANISTRGRA